MIRVMVADDHPVVRLGLRALVEAEPDMSLIGEASDGHQAVRRVCELRPDVIVLDLHIPGLSGMEAAGEIARQAPDTRCLILTMDEEQAQTERSLRESGISYVDAHAVGSQLANAIRGIASRDMQQPANDQEGRSDTVPRGDGLEWLSNRERQVAVMLARGLTAREIGEAIQLSHKTVGTYRGRIYHKLGVRSRAEITQAVLRAGLLSFERSA
ncbi:MAG: response regulator transcription factor [Myxococcales bacterium]|nr:response regulator transcription factor [Myxococcales bacterium]